MSNHPGAWEGIEFLIYGENPLVPMQIEQLIVKAIPNIEKIIESFDDYNDAYDYAKANSNSGLLILVESDDHQYLSDVADNLSKPFEQVNGWKPSVFLVSREKTSKEGFKFFAENKSCIGYESFEDLKDQNRVGKIFEELWKSFRDNFEAEILPDALQNSLISISLENGIDSESDQFIQRSSILISDALNVSWLESISLKWYSILRFLDKNSSSSISNQIFLKKIVEFSEYGIDTNDRKSIYDFIYGKENDLLKRICASIDLMNARRKEGRIDSFFDEIESINKRKTGLVKKIIDNRQVFNNIALDISNHNTKKLKIG